MSVYGFNDDKSKHPLDSGGGISGAFKVETFEIDVEYVELPGVGVVRRGTRTIASDSTESFTTNISTLVGYVPIGIYNFEIVCAELNSAGVSMKSCMLDDWLFNQDTSNNFKVALQNNDSSSHDVDVHFKAWKASVRYGNYRRLVYRLNRWYESLWKGAI